MASKQTSRLHFALWHLLISCLIAGAVALLVFKFWYPSPLNLITGGLHLFFLVVGVDLVCGPLFTMIMANPKKSKRELTFDLCLVGLIQLAALGYGLYTVKLARPVIMSFEHDRIAVITEAEIDKESLSKAPKGLQTLPWFGQQKVGIRRAKDEKEFFESLHLSTSEGIEPSLRPNWWLSFDKVLPDVKKKMRPLSELAARPSLDEERKSRLHQVAADTGISEKDLYFLPLTSKYTKDWVVLLNKDADFVGYANVNGFDEEKK